MSFKNLPSGAGNLIANFPQVMLLLIKIGSNTAGELDLVHVSEEFSIVYHEKNKKYDQIAADHL